jgi:hypothetical protein
MRANLILFLLLSWCNVLWGETVRIVPVAIAVQNLVDPETRVSVVDGFIVYVYIFNDAEQEVVLPSKGLYTQILNEKDKLTVLYGYHVRSFVSKSGRRSIIPTLGDLAPITLRRGECMVINPIPYAIERSVVGDRRVVFRLETKGFLSDRLKFTSVEVEGALIVHDRNVAPERRDP